MTGPHRFVLAAGGTGGHVFPAQALSGELSRRGHAIDLVTDRRGDSYADGFPGATVHGIRAGRLSGGPVSALKGLASLGVGTLQARRLLRRLRPDAAIGFGGYPSIPTMLAARWTGVPSMLHEQNAVLGRANKLLAGKVQRIATAFENVSGVTADSASVARTGNPVRDDIIALRDQPYRAPEPDGALRILIMGGSQGARILSDVVPAALTSIDPALRSRLEISQQCRPEDLDRVTETYRAADMTPDLRSFFDDVPDRLRAAHLVISRAGASTVTELCVAGRPAVLVPYAAATDDHQTANARAIADAGGAWLMAERDFTAETLANRIASLLTDPAPLAGMAAAAHHLGTPDAASRLADAIEQLATETRASTTPAKGART